MTSRTSLSPPAAARRLAPILSPQSDLLAQIPAALKPRCITTAARSQLTGIAFSPDSARLALVSFEGVEIWDVRTFTRLQRLTGEEYYKTPVFSPDGRRLLCGTAEPKDELQWWDIAAGKRLSAWKARKVTPDGSCLLREDVGPLEHGEQWQTGQVSFYDLLANRSLSPVRYADAWQREVYLSPGLRLVAMSGQNAGAPDGMVRVYDLRTGRRRVTLSDPRGELAFMDGVCGPMDFSPDGKLLVTNGEDPKFRVGHNPENPGAAVSEASYDRALPLKLWHLRTGKLLRMWPGQHPRSQPIFLRGGKRIAGVGYERLDVWDVASGRLVYRLNFNDIGLHGQGVLASDHHTLAFADMREVILLTLPAPLETITSHN